MSASRATLLALLLAATPLGSAGAAEIAGQIVHPDDPAEARGLEVQLLGLVPDGDPIARDTRSDPQGRFRFRALQAPAAYLILVHYEGVGFHGESVRLGPDDDTATRELVFSYDLEAAGGVLDSELPLPDGAPALELFVKDDRLAIDVGELHPARVSRDADGRSFQRYLGFDMPPGATIPLRIRPLPPLVSGGSWAAAVAAALVAGGLLFFVGRPLGASSRSEHEPQDDPEASEKEALFAALRDLEHDYETGKLSPDDRDRLREELRRSALLGMTRARAATPPEPAEAGRSCPGCGRTAASDDRFCAGCGARL